MLTQDEARARVAKGAAHLDTVRPGWQDRIDVGTLTLHDPCGCIIGQLCGENYGQGLLSICGPDENIECWGSRHGFDLSAAHIDQRHREVLFQPLQDAWVEAIADRRLAAQKLAEVPVCVR